MTAGTQPVHQRIAVSAGKGRFAGSVNVGDDDGACIVHAGAEFGKERCETRIAVRLHDGDDIARASLACSLEDRGDFNGVVAVVIDDGDAARLACLGKAALDTFEVQERAAQRLFVYVHLHADGDGGKRVLNIMLPQHRQAERAEAARALAVTIGDFDLEGRT